MNLQPFLLAAENPIKEYSNNKIINNFLNKFNLDDFLWDVATKIISIILISLLFWFISAMGKKIITHLFNKYQGRLEVAVKGNNVDKNKLRSKRRNKTIFTLTENAYYYVVIFFWLYSILAIVGIPVGTLIAGAGIFSLAIGLGAQGFVSDIVSGFFLLFENQIDVGEHVIINEIDGFVVAIGLRTTQVRTLTGTLNFIPNRNITTVSNLSRDNILALVDIRIMPDSPIDKIKNIMIEVNKAKKNDNPDVIGDPLIFGTVYLKDGSLAVESVITVKSSAELRVQAEYLAAYLDAFKEAGIELPLSPISVPKAK
ncbi:mechanosensitive ion channel [Fructilactobacillus vespulae]|uniref:mechanosensitive ion channel family protein n=1 Tax=Fructilactobacillus vespulae TaxID=1249630 RepID=UPI0039B6E06D